MAVLKEWQCECGKAFEALAPICPRCGRQASRAFFTPVSINRGRSTTHSAKAIDHMLEAEFKRQGISNFYSGRGAENKVEYAQHAHAGTYASQMSGTPAQPAISAQWVRGGLSNPQLSQSLRMDGNPWSPPQDDAAVMTRPGTKVGTGLNPNQVRSRL